MRLTDHNIWSKVQDSLNRQTISHCGQIALQGRRMIGNVVSADGNRRCKLMESGVGRSKPQATSYILGS